MSNSLHKQLASALFWCAALGLFVVPVSTSAFFSDTETAVQQQFQAAELQLDTTLVQSDLALGENQPAASTTLVVDTSAHSVPAAFDIAVSDVAGELEFCDNLQLRADGASLDTQSILGAFTTPKQTALGAYALTVSLIDPTALTIGEVCTATVTITAWQQNMNKTTGYRDVNEYQIRLTAADLAVVQRLSAPVTAEGEVAGASVSALSDSNAAPTKADAAPEGASATPPKPPTPDTKASTDSDAASPKPGPTQPAGDQATVSDADPTQTTDQPEPEPKIDPEAPAEPVAAPKATVAPEQPAAPPETEVTAEAESTTNESSPEPVAEPEPGEEATKEEDEAVTEQPAVEQPKPQPESDTETQIENQPVNKPESTEELEPAKPEVDDTESETE